MTRIAFSIRQPWAAAILHLGKPVENRSWPMPRQYIHKPLLLHAGKAKPRPGEWSGLLFERAMSAPDIRYGGIIGEIIFGPSVRGSVSEWAEPGCWHWPVLNVRALEFFPCRGALGFFKVNYPEIA